MNGAVDRFDALPYPLTAGEWATEVESVAALDAAIARTGLFHVYREVPGRLVHPRPCQDDKTVRIDRVLLPNARCRLAGWQFGAVGIEAKASGVKLGRPVSQLLDYGRSVWVIADLGGLEVWLGLAFLWPLEGQHGPVASVMAQNRVGSAWITRHGTLELRSGQELVLGADWVDESIKVGTSAIGRKVGSR